ncbi:hypothetical protein [Clostridium sp.]|uniref:hypothetical protein n=1 Tax=Clostridium sp. TaxID=1506 RepID=UPI0032162C22
MKVIFIKNNDEPVSLYDKIVFILKYVFLGYLIWAYWNTLFSIAKKSLGGTIVAILGLILFQLFKTNIDPRKTNNSEFGEYTDYVGIFISIALVMFFLYHY